LVYGAVARKSDAEMLAGTSKLSGICLQAFALKAMLLERHAGTLRQKHMAPIRNSTVVYFGIYPFPGIARENQFN